MKKSTSNLTISSNRQKKTRYRLLAVIEITLSKKKSHRSNYFVRVFNSIELQRLERNEANWNWQVVQLKVMHANSIETYKKVRKNQLYCTECVFECVYMIVSTLVAGGDKGIRRRHPIANDRYSYHVIIFQKMLPRMMVHFLTFFQCIGVMIGRKYLYIYEVCITLPVWVYKSRVLERKKYHRWHFLFFPLRFCGRSVFCDVNLAKNNLYEIRRT